MFITAQTEPDLIFLKQFCVLLSSFSFKKKKKLKKRLHSGRQRTSVDFLLLLHYNKFVQFFNETHQHANLGSYNLGSEHFSYLFANFCRKYFRGNFIDVWMYVATAVLRKMSLIQKTRKEKVVERRTGFSSAHCGRLYKKKKNNIHTQEIPIFNLLNWSCTTSEKLQLRFYRNVNKVDNECA